MHYCFHIYTKEFPTDEVLGRILAPYNEDKYYQDEEIYDEVPRPPFLWDWWQVGGRYGGALRLVMNKESYELKYMARHRRAGRLFRSALFERSTFGILDSDLTGIPEESALPYITHDGAINVDGGWLPDILDHEEIATSCYGIVVDDGTVLVREIWDGEQFLETENFEDKAHEIMQRCEDAYYLTIVDIHD